MKTTSFGAAALIAALAISFNGYADSPFTEREARSNAAVAASPRARESFAWLTRTATVSGKGTAALSRELNNAAYAKSPRMLETYPELSRENTSGVAGCVRVPELMNRGFTASPRAKETFPFLRTSVAATAPCILCQTGCACCG